MAPPLVDIAESKVAAMAYAGASDRMIGEIVGVAHTTIERRYAPLLAKQRALRRLSLLQLQWKAAQKGNPAILIFLGKQELGQEDVLRLEPGDVENMTDAQVEALIKRGRRVRSQLK